MSVARHSDPEAELARLRQELSACKAQLVEAHQMISVGQLLTGIIHEINTPVGSILSNNQVGTKALETLRELLEKARREGTPPPPKAVQLLETLLSLASVDKLACERIISVIRGLRTLVGGKETDFVKADVNEILDNALKLARCEFRRRIQVETDYGELPRVECDPHQLGQVFLNLLVNAGHAIVGEGRVGVRTRQEGEFIRISIADSGCGIAPEHRSKIFCSGFTTKPPGVGTGLGLAISREIIVDGHGGSIEFETEEGRGTTFHIRIPVSRAVPAAEK